MDPEDKIFDQRVEACIGNILNTKGDAVVNTTDSDLKHDRGQVSRVFLQHLGERLVQVCKSQYPGGIGNHKVAVTDALELSQFKHIFHVALPPQVWNAHDATKQLQQLQSVKSCVEACLKMATDLGLSSIVFPAIATGNLQYPSHLEARTVLETTRQFFHRMPQSSLQKVTFVVFMENPAVAKVFKAEETVHRYCPGLYDSADRKKVERQFQVKKVLVQVIKGDATTHRCTAELLICADPPATGILQSYLAQMGAGCSHETVDIHDVQNEVQALLENTTASSVQLNMQTFAANHVNSIVKGIEQANIQTVQIIVIVVSSSDVFGCLSTTFATTRPYKSVAMDSDMGANDEIKSFFQSLYQASSRGASRVPEGRAPQGLPTPTAPAPDQQAQNTVTLEVPREQLKGVDFDTLLDEFEKLNISVSFRGGLTRFRTNKDTMDKLAAHVQKTLAKVTTMARPAVAPVPQQTVASEQTDVRRFQTQTGLKVSVYTGDITVAQVDAIVNAANEKLTHQLGIAANIARAAGQVLQGESNQYIAKNGPLKVTDAVITTGGALPCKNVIHALGPRWDQYTDKQLCRKHLTDTIYNCLEKAHGRTFKSIAFCCVSSGIFGVPLHVCAQSYLEAVQKFEDKSGTCTDLQNIYFVDIDKDKINTMKDCFAAHWRSG